MLIMPVHRALFDSRPDINCEFLGPAVSDATDLTTYTFTAQKFGRPHSARHLIVAYHAEDALATFTLSSMTITPTGQTAIGTTSATATGAAPTIKAGLRYARVPVGWSGDVSLTFDEAITSCGIAIYALYGIPSYRIFGNLLQPAIQTGGVAADNTAFALNSYGPAVVICAATVDASGDRCTYTGVDEMYDQDIGAEAGMAGGFRKYTSTGGISTTADFVTGTTVEARTAVFY